MKSDQYKTDLLEYFETKPTHKKTIVFKTSDIYISKPGLYTIAETNRHRRLLGMWLYQRMRPVAIINQYVISILIDTVPYRYLVTRTE